MLYGNKAGLDLLNQYQPRLNSWAEKPVLTPVRYDDNHEFMNQDAGIRVDMNQNLEKLNNLDALYKHNPYIKKQTT